jgi:dipeptidyl aminopeptidase/acylaminoacyl peptidase
MAPDGTKGVFIRNWNLWVRDVASGQERQLTTDGVPNYGYATDNAGWTGSAAAIVQWSPDSRKIATQQQDERRVGDMYLVSTSVGHPTLRAWKYPLPGDSVVAMLRRVIIEVETGRIVPLQLPMEYHRATLGDDISMNDYIWSPDGSRLALASTSRDHKDTWVRVADASTGAVRTVLHERVETHFESRTGWRVLWNTNELIWYSQRDNWGHLYLYDLGTGQLKNRITSGEGPVSQIVRLDTAARTLWFTGLGRERGQDPYYRHYYRIRLDGSGYVSLTPDDGDHAMQLSPSGRWLIDTHSTPERPPVVALRDGMNGGHLLDLERADITALLATGWKPPMSVRMKAADGTTDIYGLLFRPTRFDSTRRYPIINQIYPGPQSGSVGSRSFTAARGDRQALAELGFIVVSIDGTGTPGRSKSFHDAYYGAMGRHNTIPDQIAGMRELAQRYRWIDIERTGIWGHSGGGFATTSAMFRYPDFWKVGISESGNHDQRNYEDDWGERYQGLLTGPVGPSDNYNAEGNQVFAKDLKGKLLLAHGGADNNVPPSNTLLVVEALVAANKDFDLIVFPNTGHGFGGNIGNYMMRKRWDYFVTHLLGATPPAEYTFPAAPAGGRGGRGG